LQSLNPDAPNNLPTPGAPAPATEPFLDPQTLIERSQVVAAPGGTPYFLMFVLLGPLLLFLPSSESPTNVVLKFVILIALLGLSIVWWLTTKSKMEAHRRESIAVDALDELVQLRRWTDAATHAQRILSDGMLSAQRRMQALLSLATILLRYHRFDDARVVHDYLLNPEDGAPTADGPTGHSIRVARAMALLRDDRLVDADRAINELRRDVRNARDEARRGEAQAREQRELHEPRDAIEARESLDARETAPIESAGLALVELYRDIKTGHPDEAVALFEDKRKALRDQLGHRVGDAWALVAKAYDLQGHADQARDAYLRATALCPPVELHRRYPETADLESKYPATAIPRK
jgi:tetratricopeptide (TPR) repeat protein